MVLLVTQLVSSEHFIAQPDNCDKKEYSICSSSKVPKTPGIPIYFLKLFHLKIQLSYQLFRPNCKETKKKCTYAVAADGFKFRLLYIDSLRVESVSVDLQLHI